MVYMYRVDDNFTFSLWRFVHLLFALRQFIDHTLALSLSSSSSLLSLDDHFYINIRCSLRWFFILFNLRKYCYFEPKRQIFAPHERISELRIDHNYHHRPEMPSEQRQWISTFNFYLDVLNISCELCEHQA